MTEPSEELIARTLARVEAEYNKTHPAPSAPAANTEGLRDSQRLDWIEHVMTYDDNYVEVYLSGLRNQTGKATAFQVEVNPEKIATLNAPTLREAIDAAQGKWEREVTEEHAARTPPPAEPGLRSRMEKLADMYEADGVAHVARDIRAELGYWNTKYEFKSPEDVEKRFPSLFRNSPHSKKAGNDMRDEALAILASAPTDGALSASELEVAVHRNMEVPSIREAVVQAAIQWYCADDDFIDVRSEWLEKAVRALPEFTGDDLSPPSSWPTNEAESEAETKRALAPNEQVQVRVEPHGPATADALREAMEKLAKSYCDEAVRYRAAEIEPQIYLEEAASDIRAQIALARTPPQKGTMTIKLGYCIHCGQANITCINAQKDGTMTHYSIAKQGECGPLIIDDVEIPEPNWKADAALCSPVAAAPTANIWDRGTRPWTLAQWLQWANDNGATLTMTQMLDDWQSSVVAAPGESN